MTFLDAHLVVQRGTFHLDLALRVDRGETVALHRIEISLGAASTVFYGRGPAAC